MQHGRVDPNAGHGNLAAPPGTRARNCGRLKANVRVVGSRCQRITATSQQKRAAPNRSPRVAKGRTNVGARFQVCLGRGAGVTIQAPPQAALRDALYEKNVPGDRRARNKRGFCACTGEGAGHFLAPAGSAIGILRTAARVGIALRGLGDARGAKVCLPSPCQSVPAVPVPSARTLSIVSEAWLGHWSAAIAVESRQPRAASTQRGWSAATVVM